jgi:hypothetical protein
VGQFLKSSDSASPVARLSRTTETGIRVPRKQGAPCMTSGLTVIKSCQRIGATTEGVSGNIRAQWLLSNERQIRAIIYLTHPASGGIMPLSRCGGSGPDLPEEPGADKDLCHALDLASELVEQTQNRLALIGSHSPNAMSRVA